MRFIPIVLDTTEGIMKPSEKIIKKVKELASADILENHPYENWESREIMLEVILKNGELDGYFIKAILDHLDELSTPPQSEETK